MRMPPGQTATTLPPCQIRPANHYGSNKRIHPQKHGTPQRVRRPVQSSPYKKAVEFSFIERLLMAILPKRRFRPEQMPAHWYFASDSDSRMSHSVTDPIPFCPAMGQLECYWQSPLELALISLINERITREMERVPGFSLVQGGGRSPVHSGSPHRIGDSPDAGIRWGSAAATGFPRASSEANKTADVGSIRDSPNRPVQLSGPGDLPFARSGWNQSKFTCF